MAEDELKVVLDQINERKENFPENERTLIENWVRKLSIVSEDDTVYMGIRTEYATRLLQITFEESELQPPFSKNPPEGQLRPLAELGKTKGRMGDEIRKMPCSVPHKAQSPQAMGAIPKGKRADKNLSLDSPTRNEYEDPEEMARVIARSKGQSFPDFVLSISRHTADFGQALQQAMKQEVSAFRDYVDSVLSQRIKDLTDVLDEEQHRELQRIKKDIIKWQTELGLVKRRIKELVPDFDIDEYRSNPDYLKKIFTFETSVTTEEDPFKRWKEETCHRLKWIHEMTCKVSRCNEQTMQDISNINCSISDVEATEATKQQNHMKFLERECQEYQKMKCQRDKLQQEYRDLLMQVKQKECKC